MPSAAAAAAAVLPPARHFSSTPLPLCLSLTHCMPVAGPQSPKTKAIEAYRTHRIGIHGTSEAWANTRAVRLGLQVPASRSSVIKLPGWLLADAPAGQLLRWQVGCEVGGCCCAPSYQRASQRAAGLLCCLSRRSRLGSCIRLLLRAELAGAC